MPFNVTPREPIFRARKSIPYRRLYRFGQQYDIFWILVNTGVPFRIYRYFLLFYTIYKVIFLITQYITLATFYIFFMELLTFTTTPYMISCEGWKKFECMWVHIFITHNSSHDKLWQKLFKYCNISIVLNIKLLQYHGNMAIHVHYMSHHLGSKAKAEKKWWGAHLLFKI